MDELRELHRRALDDAAGLVGQLRDEHLTGSTPCADWDLAALLAHMTGQHLGFALAVETGTAPVGAYAPIVWTRIAWAASIERLRTAFAAADPDASVLEVELDPTRPLPLATVVGAQLLDTAVHSWDVARSLGLEYTPDPDIVDRVMQIATGIPNGENRTTPKAAFAPALVSAPGSAEKWTRCLALLGRAH